MSRETDKQILLKNLERLMRDRIRVDRLHQYEIRQLAALVAEDVRGAEATDITELLHAMEGATFLRRAEPSEDVRLAQRDEWELCQTGAVFASFLAEELGTLDFALTEPASVLRAGRIACVQSHISEAALSLLAARRPELTAVHAANAEDICLAVTAGRAEYALLPLSSEEGERLSGIERLTERYDLYLVAVVRVKLGDRTPEFGIFSLQNLPLVDGKEKYTELRIYGDSFADCAAIVAACARLGFGAERMICLPDEYDRFFARAVFRADGDPFALRIYLSMFSAGFAELGTYTVLSSTEGESI